MKAVVASDSDAERIKSILVQSFVGNILTTPFVQESLAGTITDVSVPEKTAEGLQYPWTGWELVVKSDESGDLNKIWVGDIYPSTLLTAIFVPPEMLHQMV